MLSGMKGSGTALLKQRYSWEQAKQTEYSDGWEKPLKVVLGSYRKRKTLLKKRVERQVGQLIPQLKGEIGRCPGQTGFNTSSESLVN